jgi:hypothetical protein
MEITLESFYLMKSSDKNFTTSLEIMEAGGYASTHLVK